MPTKALWRCPQCGRRFRTRNQWHSCVTYSVESHFEGRPGVIREIYDRLLAELRGLGEVRVDAVKSGINFAGRAHFAGATARASGLSVGFILDRKLDDPRIARSEWVGGSFYGHTVKLTRPEEVDEQLLGWLVEAYALKGASRV